MSETVPMWLIVLNVTFTAANAALFAEYGYWWNLAVVVSSIVILLERIASRE